MSMRIKMKSLLTCFLLFLVAGFLQAQSVHTENTLKLDNPANSPEATIDKMAWLSGNWVGEAFGGMVEDIWSDPAGGAMMGMFRSVRAGEIGFYEFITISEIENTLTIRLKHFNADLTGWEEKGEVQEFRLVKIEKNKFWFDGFTIEKKEKNSCTMYVAMERADGSFREMVFEYTRRKG